MKRGKKLWEGMLNAVFPRRCPVCDGILETDGILVCPGCRDRFKLIKGALCRRCGGELETEEEEYCPDCLGKTHIFDEGAALFTYESVRESIFRFKYMGRQEYKEYYGREIARHLGDKIRAWDADALIPVPIHKSRMRTRGYNQAELLAEEIGKQLLLPVYPKYVVREKKTAPQKALNTEERQNNLKRAFKIYRNDVKLNTIIIVDDIFTTGSTIDELAGVLREAGAKRVYFIVLSRGQGI